MSRREIERELKLPEARRRARPGRLGHRAAREPPADAASRPSAPRPTRPQGRASRRRRPPPAPPRSACSPTRPARTRGGRRRPAGVRGHGAIDGARPRAATSPRVRPRPATDIELKPCARARAWSPARSSAASASRTGGRAAPAVRDPAGRPRRPAHRPEADPRRLEAARVDRHLPRRGQEPVLRRRRRQPVDRPDPADEQGGADAAGAGQPAHRDLRVRPPRHPRRPDRPPRAGDARVPRRLRPAADGHLAEAAATAT